jgi:enediyne biosynthesis protein E4
MTHMSQLTRPVLSRTSWLWAPVAAAALFGGFTLRAAEPRLPKFTDVTDKAGIKFKHSLGDAELSNIVEGTGPGGMFFDYDNDGWLDIFFVNGCWHPDLSDNQGRALKDKLDCALYHNNRDGTFIDVTAKARVGHKGYGMSAVCGDYDNDGYLDILICGYGGVTLCRNSRDGTFTEVTAESGLGKDASWAVHAAWLDYNKDGRPDIYVVNYLTYDKGEFQRSGAYYKAENYPGPLSYPGTQNRLYRNNGNGTFTDVTQEAGLAFPNGRGMSAVAVDFNRDGNVDLFVANDSMPNNLWINDGKGHFTDKAVEYGVAFSEGGQGVSNMGPFVGDIRRKGLLDIWVPNMRYGTLFCQVSRNHFADFTAQSGLALICGQYTGWGGLLLDYDNDGYLDVFVANGDAHHLYTQESVLARNDGNGKFIDVAKCSGEYFSRKFVSRGACFGDYDNDGWLDILVFNINAAPCLLHNDGVTGQHWLKVVPVRKDNGQIALHSWVTMKTSTLTMTQPVIGVNGYLVSNDPRAHFGLGTATQADLVEITWPDGSKQTLTNVAADQILKVRCGNQ